MRVIPIPILCTLVQVYILCHLVRWAVVFIHVLIIYQNANVGQWMCLWSESHAVLKLCIPVASSSRPGLRIPGHATPSWSGLAWRRPVCKLPSYRLEANSLELKGRPAADTTQSVQLKCLLKVYEYISKDIYSYISNQAFYSTKFVVTEFGAFRRPNTGTTNESALPALRLNQ